MLAVLFVGLAMTPFPPRRAAAASDWLVVLANLEFPGEGLLLADLKGLFRARRVQVGGLRLIAINHPHGAPTREAFDRLVLGLSPEQVGLYWVDRRIRDDGVPPKVTATAELAVRVVASLRNAVTYGTRAMMTSSQVKMLRVDGKLPGDRDYPLQYP